MLARSLLISVLVIGWCNGDLYLHVPRGSNNRLNEKTATRSTNNRVFDSQNNNRGGYNVGDQGATPSKDESEQYRMKYFQSGPYKTLSNDAGKTFLEIEWTNQHGCGGNEDTNPQKQNCNLVLQYMCQDDVDSPTGIANTLRNGKNTNRQAYKKPEKLTESEQEVQNRKNKNVEQTEAIHEPWEWYDKCLVRERNKGLFTADQQLNEDNGLGYNSAIFTRQDNNGNRNGYECPEERDYYPYWHPTPWKDIAILTDDTSRCSYYENKSFNVFKYHECVEHFTSGARKHYSRWNNEEDCTQNGGRWTEFSNYLEKAPSFTSQSECESQTTGGMTFIWALPYDADDITQKECLVSLDKPECKQGDFSRNNHLGNGAEGKMNSFVWTLPHFPSGNTKRCVFRMRYNISTDDYDPFNTDSKSNQNDESDPPVQSVIEQDPYINVGGRSALRMNINTDQTGRTFQDRTHVFLLRPRAGSITPSDKIFNLNVRGKRGNIVQTFPAVEYDFHPNTLELTENDLVHVQWTGSNTHDNNNPAGDGQAGDDGQGKGGSDRSNIMQLKDLNENYPLPYEHAQTTLWAAADVKWIFTGANSVSADDLAILMASSGYYESYEQAKTKTVMNKDMNNAPASFAGAVLKFNKGNYYYMSSRNNAFSNRSQKGAIIVS